MAIRSVKSKYEKSIFCKKDDGTGFYKAVCCEWVMWHNKNLHNVIFWFTVWVFIGHPCPWSVVSFSVFFLFKMIQIRYDEMRCDGIRWDKINVLCNGSYDGRIFVQYALDISRSFSLYESRKKPHSSPVRARYVWSLVSANMTEDHCNYCAYDTIVSYIIAICRESTVYDTVCWEWAVMAKNKHNAILVNSLCFHG